ncbi:hypothetical protein TKK_0017600 [Trichogramma kaykai]
MPATRSLAWRCWHSLEPHRNRDNLTAPANRTRNGAPARAMALTSVRPPTEAPRSHGQHQATLSSPRAAQPSSFGVSGNAVQPKRGARSVPNFDGSGSIIRLHQSILPAVP